jgi:hypothetical protein
MTHPRSGRRVARRAFLKATTAGIVGAALSRHEMAAAPSGEVLYNGIRLGSPWPPPLRSLPATPVRPPYLLNPPDVISIDVGRQLFVDDFLIEATTLSRRFHKATYYSGNPVLRPSTEWEKFDAYADRTKTRSNPAAMVFSDGVFYDPKDRLFKMWYMGGYNGNTCCVVSKDGYEWTRPAFDVKPGTNIVLGGIYRDSSTIWLDHDDADVSQRFKMAMYYDKSMLLYASPDGIHWRQRGESGPTGDRTTIFYNPFRKKWVFSIREEIATFGRVRRYWESDDLFARTKWRAGEPPLWAGADNDDPPRPDYKIVPQLYTLDAVAYESLMLGLFTIWRGEPTDREKANEICLGYSRDGFHWSRPDRAAFIPTSEHVGDWNWGNVQSAGGCCLIVGDTLRFYVSGRAGVPGTSNPGVCTTGVATLRRDGFASMSAVPATTEPVLVSGLPRGTLLTRLVRFTGGHLFVNADLGDGELRASIEDEAGRPLPNLSAPECLPVRGNSTAIRVQWKEKTALARVSRRPVRFRFHLTAGQLFSFWVADTAAGASRGYVAAGGPGFDGSRDTAGPHEAGNAARG